MTLPVPSDTTPVTIWYKNQRVWRTMFSGLMALLTVVPAVLFIVNDQWPTALLPIIAAQLIAVQSAITRVMANEIVNAWLIKYTFLGSEPKHLL